MGVYAVKVLTASRVPIRRVLGFGIFRRQTGIEAIISMFFIPGPLISLITFPGVIIHELAHQAFCWLTKTPVIEVCYFRFGNPAGYVIHARPASVWRHILIGIGPLFLNTLIGVSMGLIARSMDFDLDHLTAASGILLWLAVSIAMHSFPSIGDAMSIWREIWSDGAPIMARVVGSPVVAVIILGAFGSILWLDAIYGFAVVVGIPGLLLG